MFTTNGTRVYSGGIGEHACGRSLVSPGWRIWFLGTQRHRLTPNRVHLTQARKHAGTYAHGCERRSGVAYLVRSDGWPLDRPLGEAHRELVPRPTGRAPRILGEHPVRETPVDPLVVRVVHEPIVERANQTAARHSPEPEANLLNRPMIVHETAQGLSEQRRRGAGGGVKKGVMVDGSLSIPSHGHI